MSIVIRKLLTSLSVFSLVVGSAVTLQACSVPVFRYALERWPNDPYEAFVFHRGELSADQQALVDKLGADGLAGQLSANIRPHLINLDDDPEPQLVELWEEQNVDTLPWIVVKYPRITRLQANACSLPLEDSELRRLLDSPVRQEIARKLIDGETSVWLFLDSGDAQQDDPAFELLKQELAKLELSLKLPEIAEEDIAQGLVSVDPEELQIGFSAIRLSRDNPAEKYFIDMLLGSEPEVPDLPSLREVNEPMAFPMFGRGRALYALVGAGINEEMVKDAGSHLTGPCTCTVKEQNPGTDMLTAVAWDQLVQPATEVDMVLPPLSGLSSYSQVDEPQDAATQVAVANVSEITDAIEPSDADVTTESAIATTTEAMTSSSNAAVAEAPAPAGGLARNLSLVAVLAVGAVVVVSLLMVSWKN